MTAGLSVDVVTGGRRPSVRAAFTVAAGETLAVMGPNGAGKTTLVRAIAGLEPVAHGTIVHGDAAWVDTDSSHTTGPERRDVALTFQQPHLFPHLDVTANVSFALPRPERRRAGPAMLAEFGLGHLAGRRVDSLSGGEAQRVALARALASRPAVLLLDEPFAALDVTARGASRSHLAADIGARSGPTILVTHDPVDALVLADRVVVLEAGAIAQLGTPAELARRPRTAWIARLLGLNLLTGTGTADGVAVASGAVVRCADRVVPGAQVALTIAPSAVALHLDEPAGSARNRWPMRITEMDSAGARVRIQLTGPFDLIAEVTTAAVAELALAPGRTVVATVKATEIEVFSVTDTPTAQH